MVVIGQQAMCKLISACFFLFLLEPEVFGQSRSWNASPICKGVDGMAKAFELRDWSALLEN